MATPTSPAAAQLQIKDAFAFSFDGQDTVREAHAGMHRGDKPFAVRRPVERIEMVQLFVDVLACLAGFQVEDEQPLGGEVGELNFSNSPFK